jgi:pseudaminic acid cytidylyltransferase
MSKSAIAIIPARGGSKRIPRKNARLFCGRPIIEYSIRAAIESRCFAEVMVSTDCDDIATIARDCGAAIPFKRSEINSNDYATTADVLEEVLTQYAQLGRQFQYGCCIYPTAPFVTGQMLKDSMNELTSQNLDSVVPIVKFSYAIQRAFKITNGLLAYAQPEHASTRSQDLEAMYHDAGQFYCFEIKKFLKNKSLITSNTRGVVISEINAHDIDTEDDWKIAELKWLSRNQY